MPALIVKLDVRPEASSDFEQAVRDAIVAIDADEPGCRLYRLVRSRADANSYTLLEIYADQNALGAHTNSAHYAALCESLKGKLATPPKVSLFDVIA